MITTLSFSATCNDLFKLRTSFNYLYYPGIDSIFFSRQYTDGNAVYTSNIKFGPQNYITSSKSSDSLSIKISPINYILSGDTVFEDSSKQKWVIYNDNYEDESMKCIYAHPLSHCKDTLNDIYHEFNENTYTVTLHSRVYQCTESNSECNCYGDKNQYIKYNKDSNMITNYFNYYTGTDVYRLDIFKFISNSITSNKLKINPKNKFSPEIFINGKKINGVLQTTINQKIIFIK